MTSWRDIAARHLDGDHAAKIVKIARSTLETPSGTGFDDFGDFDTLPQHEDKPPCPADIAERVALIEDGDGCSHGEARTRVLSEFGFESTTAYDAAQRQWIAAELGTLPPATDADGERLLQVTLDFVGSGHFERALDLGWTTEELFGIAPSARSLTMDRTGLGLVVVLAFPFRGWRLDAVYQGHAEFRARGKANVLVQRFRPDLEGAIVWWRHPGIAIGGDA